MGHVEECCRRESSEECIFNISENFERYTVCVGQGVSDQEQGSSTEVVGDCSVLNDRGGVSLLGKSMVYSVEVNNCFDVPQSYDTIVVAKEFYIPATVSEVVS